MGIWKSILGHDELMSVIKNTSDKSVVVFKHPNEDFNTNSRLILEESEVAVFVNRKEDGKTETLVMEEGGKLKTENLPFFRSISQILTGGVSKFHCAIYFVRTNMFINNGWGTEGAVGPLEDCRHYVFKLKANGTYCFRVTDARTLLTGLFSHGVTYATQKDIALMLNSTVSTFIGKLLCALFNFPEKTLGLTRMQEMMRTEADATFGLLMNELYEKKWGIKFSDLTMNLKDEYDELAEQYLGQNREIHNTETIDYQGESFTTIQLYEMLKKAAENPGNLAGPMMGAGVGTGMGASLGTMIGNTIMTSNIGNGQASGLPNASTSPLSRRSPGIPMQHAMQLEEEEKEKRKARLRELKEDFDEGLISEEEYAAAKREILHQMKS